MLRIFPFSHNWYKRLRLIDKYSAADFASKSLLFTTTGIFTSLNFRNINFPNNFVNMLILQEQSHLSLTVPMQSDYDETTSNVTSTEDTNAAYREIRKEYNYSKFSGK